MKKINCCIMTAMLMIGIQLLGKNFPLEAIAGPEKPIVIKAITFQSVGHPAYGSFKIYMDMVNEAANGELVIKHMGGREVIPSRDQPRAIMKGVADMALVPVGYYKGELPEANVHSYSRLLPSEERNSGFYDLMVTLHKKVNLRYLGRGSTPGGFMIFTNSRVRTPEDLKGQRIRGVIGFKPMLDELGSVMVSMPIGDMYTALERGLVKGVVSTTTSCRGFKLYEVAKFGLDHVFRQAHSEVMVMNLDKWNSISKRHQDLMIDTYWKALPRVRAYNIKIDKEARQTIVKGGLEFIKFSSDDANKFMAMIYRTGWENMRKDIDPEYFDKLLKMTGN